MLRSLGQLLHHICQRIMRDAPPRFFVSAIALLLLPLALTPWAHSQSDMARWQRLDSWPGGHQVQRVVVAQGAPQYIYALSPSGGLYVSFDTGLHWQRAELPASRNALGIINTLDIAVCPDDPAMAFLLIDTTAKNPRPMIYQTRDAGATWRAQSGLGPTRVRALAFGDRCDELFLVTLADIYQAFVPRGEDKVFVPNLQALEEARLAAIEAVDQVADLRVIRWPSSTTPSGTDEQYLYVGTRDMGLRVYTDSALNELHSLPIADDETSRFVREQAVIHAVCAHQERHGLVCVGTDYGIYASMDAGVTWFATAYALRHQRVQALLFDAERDLILAGLAGGGVYSSQDNGATWHPLGQGLAQSSVHSLAITRRAESGRILLAGTSDGIWQLPLQNVLDF